MSEPSNPPSPPENGTRNQSPDDLERLTPRPQFHPGELIPNRELWILERRLGGGGFGEVWLARHEWEEKYVAVKFCTHPASRKQLVTHEKKVVSRVMRYSGNHPNIVPLLDCNLSGDTPWLIYEYVSGGTLAQAVEKWKELPLSQRLEMTIRIMHALAGALARFHQLDPPIVHRDMKPHNVLMSGTTPRITDFGLGSSVLEARKADITSTFSGLSAALPSMLHAMGTLRYAPQEQLLGSPPSPRDDVYAMGIMAFQMVNGDLKTTPGADANDELLELQVPGDLSALIVKSVSINPDRRPKDATEWERQLAKLLPKVNPPPTPPVVSPPLSVQLSPTPPNEAKPAAVSKIQAQIDFQRGEHAFHGRGGPRDLAKAREYYEQATAQGHEEAKKALLRPEFAKPTAAELRALAEEDFQRGEAYFHGRGVPQDYAKARECYEKAAEQGHANAQYNLGWLYHNGYGVPQDYSQARRWYKKAAAQGLAGAQYNLGALYHVGQGVSQDYTKARQWYEKAAAQGHQLAKKALDRLATIAEKSDVEFEFSLDSDDSDADFELSLDPKPPSSETKDGDSEFELTLDDSSLNEPNDKGGIFQEDFEIPPLDDEDGSEAVSLDDDIDFELSLDDGKDEQILDQPRDSADITSLLKELGGAMPSFLAAEYGWTVASALQKIHERGGWHGEVRPGLLFVGPLITKVNPSGKAIRRPAPKASVKLTKTGRIPVAPPATIQPPDEAILAYLPPERIDNNIYDPRGDIYGLGASLYSFLTCRPPFVGDTPMELMAKIRSTEPLALRILRPDVPNEFSAIITKMMAKEPKARPQTAFEVCQALAPFCRASVVTTKPPFTDSEFELSLDYDKKDAVVSPDGDEEDVAPARPRKRRDSEEYYQRGEDYYFGRGVPQSYAKAREWWQKAADLGDTEAAYNLGVLYARGKGGAQDFVRARECWENAAAWGHTEAQYNLGYLLESGKGGPQDVRRAVDLYRQAARKGDRDAKKALRRLGQSE